MAEARNNPFPVDHLLRAVQTEIEAVLSGDGLGEKISLHNGSRIGSTGESREYLFSCKAWKESIGSKNLLVRLSRSRDRWESAEASRMPDGKVLVATTADLGAEPKNAQLCKDDSAILEALTERLEQAGDRDGPVNLIVAGWLAARDSLASAAAPTRAGSSQATAAFD